MQDGHESRKKQTPFLVLGTVQLGLPYGIANETGQPDQATATEIVKTAWEEGVRHFDTAQGYMDSEAVLGRALHDLGVAREARVGSKLSPFMDPRDLDSVEAAIECTLERLGVDRLWYMMLHEPAWIEYWDQGLGDLLLRYVAEGRFGCVGVSLSSPADIGPCTANPHVGIVQAPANAWDRRMERAGLLDACHRSGAVCTVRSIYLKGLLVLNSKAVARRLPEAEEPSRRWETLCGHFNAGPVELAMRYALGLGLPLVVGSESPAQIRNTAHLARLAPLTGPDMDRIAKTMDPVVHDNILDPRKWETPDEWGRSAK